MQLTKMFRLIKFSKGDDEVVEIYAVNISSDIHKYEHRLLNRLGRGCRICCENIKNKQRRVQFLVGRNLLFYIFNNIIEQKFDNELVYTKSGKPMLVNNPWNFNIAHSDDWVVCAMSGREVGIDIECANKVSGSKYVKQASKIFIEKMPSLDYLSLKEESYFWTFRESYVKMKGLSFEQWISEDSFITEISDDVLLNLQNIFIKEFQCIQGYAITCCSYEEINNNIKMIRLVDLLK